MHLLGKKKEKHNDFVISSPMPATNVGGGGGGGGGAAHAYLMPVPISGGNSMPNLDQARTSFSNYWLFCFSLVLY